MKQWRFFKRSTTERAGHWPAPALAIVAASLVSSGLLSGCMSMAPPIMRPHATLPAPAVQAVAAPARPQETLSVDPQSAALITYYANIETARLSNRMMRRDSGARDYPVSATRLAEDYIDIALRDEHTRTARGFAGGSASVLRRWQGPVRYRMEFGPSVSRARQIADHGAVMALAGRLATAARHPIAAAPLGATDGNFHVLVLSETERQNIGPRLQQLVPGIDARVVDLVTDLPRETFCLVMAFSRDGSATYSEAVAIIRAEHPDLTRLACYHEELTQGLGLASDSARARPSIFNDDQEFALITDHDLLLLRLHYDPRLSPGMTESRARSAIFSIASELAAGET